ncbi:MAG TPA: histidine decarboxylase [Rugosimonospora sp.]|nr:histidine decarboxylase [Rugosimonospora sp.]
MAIDPPETNGGPATVRARTRLAELTSRLDAAGSATLGFPASYDIDWSPLAPIFSRGLLNNLGDAYTDGLYPLHVKDFEREAVDALADLFRAPAGDRWGYVTGGATEGILHGLWLARRLYPRAVVYHSTAAHPGVSKAVDVLGMRSLVLRTDAYGELDYTDLLEQARRLRHRPAVVVANVGTTMTEATDDVRQILAALDSVSVPVGRRFVVADAALSGIPLAFVDPARRPGFDLHDGADVVVISGHKFLATPMPCAAVVARACIATTASPPVTYTGSPDTTVSSSRNGHAVLAIWYALTVLGRDGLASRAHQARRLAAYLHTRLGGLGWPADRRPLAMTVTIAAPSAPLRRRWRLAVQEGRSHIVCVPGVTRELLDEFLASLDGDHTDPDTNQASTANGKTGLLPAGRVEAHPSRRQRQAPRDDAGTMRT